MIRIRRNPDFPALPVYTERRSTALDGETRVTRYDREKEKAIAHYTDPENFNMHGEFTKGAIGFTVYKDGALREELAKIFHTKCAYCESEFGAVSPRDIEHFRPKGQITIARNVELKPAYFWVAGDWSNLLVSCIDCNRSRNHIVPGQHDEVLRGKGDQFPLSDESRRVRDHDGDLNDEDDARLLIDPCFEDPEAHLEFLADGQVQPREDGNGIPSEKGRISIDVYALQRSELIKARKKELLSLEHLIEEFTRNIFINNRLVEVDAPADIRVMTDLNIQRCIEKLDAMFDDGAEYLAAKRDWMREADVSGRLDGIRAFQIEPMDVVRPV